MGAFAGDVEFVEIHVQAARENKLISDVVQELLENERNTNRKRAKVFGAGEGYKGMSHHDFSFKHLLTTNTERAGKKRRSERAS